MRLVWASLLIILLLAPVAAYDPALVPSMTDDNTPTGYHSSGDSGCIGGLWLPWREFDGAINRGYGTNNGGSSAWVQIQIPSARKLTSYDLSADSDTGYGPLHPTKWKIYGSNDGANWDLLHDQSTTASFADGETKHFTPDTITTAYTYFKFVSVTDPGYARMGEWTLYGVAPQAPIYPDASWGAAPTSGAYPLTVTFSDTGSNATSWWTDFGDGNTSALENVDHTYVFSGDFTINRSATNSNGTTWLNRSSYIHVTTPTPTPTTTPTTIPPTAGPAGPANLPSGSADWTVGSLIADNLTLVGFIFLFILIIVTRRRG